MEKTDNVRVRLLLLCSVICICAIAAVKVLAADYGNSGGLRPAAKWQYLALTHNVGPGSANDDLGRNITKLGQEAWELVSVENFTESGTTTKTVYYFKKQL
ncbi:MAG: hypothetical protein ACYSWO_04950 [Planctomycetota bacterium]|jgi:hypothetical protein